MSLLFTRVTPLKEATGFEAYEYQVAPTWLQGTYGKALLSSLGVIKDAIMERSSKTAELRMPSFCPSDALAPNGSERYLERGVSETEASYRAWLLRGWEFWQEAGTRRGVARQLAHFLGVTESAVHLFELWPFQIGPVSREVAPPAGYSITPASGWRWGDGDTAHWSRFWIEINAVPPWGYGTRMWDDGGTWDGDVVWDSLATLDEVRRTLTSINKWKPAHAVLAGLKFKTTAGSVYVGAPGLVVGGFTVGASTGASETAEWGPGAGS